MGTVDLGKGEFPASSSGGGRADKALGRALRRRRRSRPVVLEGAHLQLWLGPKSGLQLTRSGHSTRVWPWGRRIHSPEL